MTRRLEIHLKLRLDVHEQASDVLTQQPLAQGLVLELLETRHVRLREMGDQADFWWEGQRWSLAKALQNCMMQEFRNREPVIDRWPLGIDDARPLTISLFPNFINQLPAILARQDPV